MGIPASGKTTQAKKLAEKYNAKIHSYDDIVDISDIFGTNKRWIENMRKDLIKGYSVICDSTNLTRKSREWILSQIDFPCEKTLVVMVIPVSECLKRNADREGKVEEQRILDASKIIESPSEKERWDEIYVFQ